MLAPSMLLAVVHPVPGNTTVVANQIPVHMNHALPALTSTDQTIGGTKSFTSPIKLSGVGNNLVISSNNGTSSQLFITGSNTSRILLQSGLTGRRQSLSIILYGW